MFAWQRLATYRGELAAIWHSATGSIGLVFHDVTGLGLDPDAEDGAGHRHRDDVVQTIDDGQPSGSPDEAVVDNVRAVIAAAMNVTTMMATRPSLSPSSMLIPVYPAHLVPNTLCPYVVCQAAAAAFCDLVW